PSGVVLPPQGPATQPFTLTVQYSPGATVTETGFVKVTAIQDGVPVDYMARIVGTGITSGQHTDAFTRPLAPKVDVLMNLDDSACNTVTQMAIANSYEAFMSYATDNEVDYQIAMITADGTNPAMG